MEKRLVLVMLLYYSQSSALVYSPVSVVSLGNGGNAFSTADPFSVFYSFNPSKSTELAFTFIRPFHHFDINAFSFTAIKRFGISQLSNSLTYLGNGTASSLSGSIQNRLEFGSYSLGAQICYLHTIIRNYESLKQIKGFVYSHFKIDKHWQSFIAFEINNESNDIHKSIHWNTYFSLKYMVSSNTHIDILHEMSGLGKNAINVSLEHQHKNGYRFFSGYNFSRNSIGIGMKKRKGNFELGLAFSYNNFLGTGHALESHYAF